MMLFAIVETANPTKTARPDIKVTGRIPNLVRSRAKIQPAKQRLL